MPLVVADLTAALTACFQAYPPSGAIAADTMANAYLAYALKGMFGVCQIVISPAGAKALKGALLAAVGSPMGTPASFGQAWATGLQGFWTSGTVQIVPTPPVTVGIFVACPGAAGVSGSISGAVANPANTAPSFAAQLAGFLDVATKTATANLTIPPAGPAPFPLL